MIHHKPHLGALVKDSIHGITGRLIWLEDQKMDVAAIVQDEHGVLFNTFAHRLTVMVPRVTPTPVCAQILNGVNARGQGITEPRYAEKWLEPINAQAVA